MTHSKIQDRLYCLMLTCLMVSGVVLPLAAWGNIGPARPASENDASRADYYLLKTGGRSIGTVTIQRFEEGAGRITQVENRNHFTRMGEPFEQVTTTRFVENPVDGSPVRFSHHFRIADESAAHTEGQIQAETLHVASRSGDLSNEASQQQAMIRPDQFYFPSGDRIERVFQEHYDAPPGTQFQYQTLHLALAPQIVNTEVTVLSEDGGATRHAGPPLKKFQIRNPDARDDDDEVIVEWRDSKGRLVRALSENMGTELVYAGKRVLLADNRLDREGRVPLSGTARLDQVNALDVMNSTRIVSNPIDMPRQTYDVIYRINRFQPTGPGDLSRVIARDERQEIQENPDGSVRLRVRQLTPENTNAAFPIRFDRTYLESSPYIQADDPQIAALAREIVQNEKRAYFAMQLMQRWVHENIRNKSLALGFASARETLLRREGDCTEHAVLLAALARSVGIPARVAVGLTYLPGDDDDSGYFFYHMWSEAYIGDDKGGNWVPFDATNPETVMDSAHIKLADSALRGSDDVVRLSQKVAPLLGELNIQVVRAVARGASRVNLAGASEQDKMELSAGGIRQVDLTAPTVKLQTRASIGHFQFSPLPAEMSTDTPEGLLTRAVEAMTSGNYGVSVRRIEQASSRLDSALEHYRLGEQLTGLGLYRLAYVEFEKAINKDASLSSSVNEWLDAYFPKVVLREPMEKRFVAAMAAERQGDFEAARVAYREILAEAPQFSPAYIHLARMANREGDTDAAVAAYEKALLVNPQDGLAYAELGDVFLEAGQYRRAMERYKKAEGMLKLQSHSSALREAETMKARYQLARGAQDVAVNENNSAAWLAIGKALHSLKRPSEARDAIHNVLALSPHHAEARAWQFRLLMGEGRWLELDGLYGQYEKLLSQTAMGLRLKGEYELKNRQYRQAEDSLKLAIAASPTSHEPYLLLAEVYDHQAAVSPGRASHYEEQAIRTLKKGVARAKENLPQLQYSLARRLIESAKPEEAAPVIGAMLASDRMNPLAYQLRGLQHFYQARWPEALDSLGQSLALRPNHAQTLKWRGDVYRELGEIGKAYQDYQAALKYDMTNTELANELADFVETYQLAVKKPERQVTLDADERTYLIQTLRLLETYVAYHEREVNHLMMLYDNMGKARDLEGIQKLEHLENSMQLGLKERVKIYEKYNQIQPPERLRILHDTYLVSFYNNVVIQKLVWKGLLDSSFRGSSAKGPEVEEVLNRMETAHKHFGNSMASLVEIMARIEANSPADWQKVMIEVGWDNFEHKIENWAKADKKLMAKMTEQSKKGSAQSVPRTQPGNPLPGQGGGGPLSNIKFLD